MTILSYAVNYITDRKRNVQQRTQIECMEGDRVS